MFVCVLVWMSVCMNVYMYAYMYNYVWMYMYMYVWMYICIYVSVCMSAHKDIHYRYSQPFISPPSLPLTAAPQPSRQVLFRLYGVFPFADDGVQLTYQALKLLVRQAVCWSVALSSSQGHPRECWARWGIKGKHSLSFHCFTSPLKPVVWLAALKHA